MSISKISVRLFLDISSLKNYTEISPAIMEWLYEHSAGVISVVVALIHDAMEIAILTEEKRSWT